MFIHVYLSLYTRKKYKSLYILNYFDIDLNNVCSVTKSLNAEIVLDIQDHPVHVIQLIFQSDASLVNLYVFGF